MGAVWSGGKAYAKIASARSAKSLAEAGQAVDKAASQEAQVLAKSADEVIPTNTQAVDGVVTTETKVAAQAVDGVPGVNPAVATEPPVTTVAANIETPNATTSTTIGTAEEKAQLEAFEAGYAQSEIDASPIYKDADGTPRLRLNSDDALERLYDMSQKSDLNVLRTPMTDEELLRVGKELAGDPAIIDKIAAGVPGTVLNDKETMALKYLLTDADRALAETADALTKDLDNPLLQAKLFREMDRYGRVVDIRTGVASQKGATLRAEQVAAAALGVPTKEGMQMIGAQGRAKLIQDVVDNYGGSEMIKKVATNINVLKDLAKATNTPNASFANAMNEALTRAKWMPLDDAITKVAINGMLSSPMTSTKAVISNTVMAGTTTLENYVQSGIGLIARRGDRKTITEANAHLMGLIEGFAEAWRPSWKVLKTGEAPRIVRQELKEAATQTLNQDDVAFKAMGAQMETVGQIAVPATLGEKVTNVLSLGGYPVRVLMAVDTFFNHANTKAFLSAESARLSLRLSKAGASADDIAKTVAAFEAAPPANILNAADEFAKTTTFAKELTGLAEKFNNTISGASQKIPLMRVLVPFFKTNANMVEEVMERSPLAPIWSSDFKAAWAAGGRQQDEALAKVATGTTTLGVLAYLSSKGLINGNGKENPEIELALRDNKTVAPPTSIKINDTWVSVKGIDPLSSMVDAAHFLSKASGHLSEEDYQAAVTSLGYAASTLALPEQLTDSMAGLLQIIRGEDGWKDTLAGMTTRFTPAGGALNDIRQTMDPKLRQASLGSVKDFDDLLQTVQMKFKNQIPGMSIDLPASRNLWGEVLTLPDGIGVDAITPFAATNDDGMLLKNTLEKMEDYYDMNKESVQGVFNRLEVKIPDRYVRNPLALPEYPMQYRMTPKEFGAYQMYRAGKDPATGKPLDENGGDLKQRFYDTMSKYNMFDRDMNKMSPQEYQAVSAELAMHLGKFKEIADHAIRNFGDVNENMRKQSELSRSVMINPRTGEFKPTIGGVKDVLK